QARIALVYAVLCMARQIGHLRGATKRLVSELERQILPDGGHITRKPGAIVALFSGMGPTPPDLLATVLAYDDARGTPVANAPYSGYQRIDAGPTVVLMDTGSPPPAEVSADAHAGCLAFEFSAKQQRIVVNCGMPGNSKENWRQVARATAAHSTVTFNDTSSCRFLDSVAFRRLFGVPIVEGPENVTVSRE